MKIFTCKIKVLVAPDEELPVDVETGQLARGVAADVLEVVHLDTHPCCSFNLFLTGTVIFFLLLYYAHSLFIHAFSRKDMI